MMNRRAFLTGVAATALAVKSAPTVDLLDLVPRIPPDLLDWVPCDGREMSRALYPHLFSLFGNLYGQPTSSAVFKIPKVPGLRMVARDNYCPDGFPLPVGLIGGWVGYAFGPGA